jgi:hypothetical protein
MNIMEVKELVDFMQWTTTPDGRYSCKSDLNLKERQFAQMIKL